MGLAQWPKRALMVDEGVVLPWPTREALWGRKHEYAERKTAN
jgi:hypothetical protein